MGFIAYWFGKKTVHVCLEEGVLKQWKIKWKCNEGIKMGKNKAFLVAKTVSSQKLHPPWLIQ